MLYYHIKTGTLLQDAAFLGTGYSGKGHSLSEGRNNPLMINVAGVGPIPPAVYKIGPSYDDAKLGPCVMHLDPDPDDQNVFGRSLFRIHGDNARDDASHGCIILGRAIREEIAKSGQKFLTVTIS